LLILFGTLFSVLIRKGLRKTSPGLICTKAIQQILNRVIPLLAVLVITMYTYLVSSALSPFKCKFSNNQYVMYDNPSSLCFDDIWYSKLGQVVIFCLIYGLLAPGLIIFMFYSNRKNLKDPIFVARFGALIRNYKDSFFWWDLMPMLKRAIFVVSAAFLLVVKTEVTLSYITQFFLFCYVALEVSCNPYKEHNLLVISIW
jgi:hypothetical protein